MINNTFGTQQTIRIVGLCGSMRLVSTTSMAIQIALEGAAEFGCQTELLNLNNYNLEFGDVTRISSPGVRQLRQDIGNAQGILLGTPEYHGSFSGVIKHALDFMGFEQLEGKIVGLIGVSGGTMGAINALNGLRIVSRSLRAWAVPDQVSITKAEEKFDKEGQPIETGLRERLVSLGQQVARFSYLHTSQEARDFIKLWEKAPQNPGG